MPSRPIASWPLRANLAFGLLLAAGWTGCAPSQLHYTLEPRGGVETLVPPELPATVKPRQLLAQLADGPGCEGLRAGFSDNRVGFEWRLERRRLSVTESPIIGRFSGNLPLPLLDGLQRLHGVLDQAVAGRCLASARRDRLLRAVAESMPLAPDVAQAIILGPYATQRYADLNSGMFLSLSYALDRAHPNRYDLGYVIRQYRFADDTGDGRGRLQVLSTQVRAAPAPPRLPPAAMAMPLEGPARYFRLFFYLRRSDADHDVALLTAATHSALEAATHILLTVPGSCSQLQVADAECLVAPAESGLDAEVAVQVNGRTTTVPLPATVEQALQAAGGPPAESLLRRLHVSRTWRGREIPVVCGGPRCSLPRLILSGGERITWK